MENRLLNLRSSHQKLHSQGLQRCRLELLVGYKNFTLNHMINRIPQIIQERKNPCVLSYQKSNPKDSEG
jgi:hypothetical protein